MTPKKTTEPRDDDGLGVLDESASLDTTGIGILPGTAQVSVALPQDDDDDLVDDDVIADEDAFSELILDERVVIEPVLAGEIGRINEETADIIIELPAEPREEPTTPEAVIEATDAGSDAEASEHVSEEGQSTADAEEPVIAAPAKPKKKSRIKVPKSKKAVVESEPEAEPKSELSADSDVDAVVDAPVIEQELPIEADQTSAPAPAIELDHAVELDSAIDPEPELDNHAEPVVEAEAVSEAATDSSVEADATTGTEKSAPADAETAAEVEPATPAAEADSSAVVETANEPASEIDESSVASAESTQANAEPVPVEESVDQAAEEDSAEAEAVESIPEFAPETVAVDAEEAPQETVEELAAAEDESVAVTTPTSESDAFAALTEDAAVEVIDDEAEEIERIESIEALLAAADATHDEPESTDSPKVSGLTPTSSDISDEDSRLESAESAPATKETVSAVTNTETNERALAPRSSADAARAARPEMTLTSKRLGELSEPSRESADLLTADRLLDPQQITKPEPEGTWAHFLYTISGRKINIGDGKRARARKELTARIAAPLLGGARFVPVLSRKGGVGKTTITTLLGMALADAREDRVIAVDANPDRGTLADRIPRTNNKSVRDLVRVHDDIKGYHDVSAIVARDATRLDVLASDSDPHVAEAFSDDDYRDVADVAARYYSLVLTDTGTGIVHSVMGATLDLSDQLIIVSGLSVDEARLASETLTWLESNGYGEQARDAIVVLNQSTPGVPLVRLNELEAHFATRTKRVVRVPYDAQIAGGGAIVFANLQPETRQAARELAAHLVEGLRARNS